MSAVAWVKSSSSQVQGFTEAGRDRDDTIFMRNAAKSAVITMSPVAFRDFLAAAKAGEFDSLLEEADAGLGPVTQPVRVASL